MCFLKTCLDFCYTFLTSSFATPYSVLPARCGAQKPQRALFCCLHPLQDLSSLLCPPSQAHVVKKGNFAPWIQRARRFLLPNYLHVIACRRNLVDLGIDKALRWAKIWNKSVKTKPSCLDFSYNILSLPPSLPTTFVMHVCQ